MTKKTHCVGKINEFNKGIGLVFKFQDIGLRLEKVKKSSLYLRVYYKALFCVQ